MKKAISRQKWTVSQKGFSPIYIIVGVVVLAIVAFALYSQNITEYPAQQVTSQMSEVSNKVDGQTYTFNYPEGYVKKEEEGYILNYENPNTQATTPETVSLKIEETGKPIQEPTTAYCAMLAKQFRINDSDNITVDVLESEEDIVGVGCRVVAISQVDGVNDSVVSLNKLIWDPKDQTGKLYKVRALAFENASKEQSTVLREAINSFSLK